MPHGGRDPPSRILGMVSAVRHITRILPPPGQGGKEAYGKRPGPAHPPVPSLTISDFEYQLLSSGPNFFKRLAVQMADPLI